MNIVFVSAFRNMAGRVGRYIDQVSAFSNNGAAHADSVRIVAVEGDSYDRTPSELEQLSAAAGVNLEICKHHHGKRIFGSTEDPVRLKALTGVMMAGMGAVKPSDDFLVYVESDLLWKSGAIMGLIGLAQRREADIVAPLVFHGEYFYDVFAFRKNGRRFIQKPPYHSELLPAGQVTPVDSVGSCLVMRAEIAGQVEPTEKLGLISWCNAARQAGFSVGVAPEFRVEHP